MTETDLVEAFRQRARHEAQRYGSDPWVFVRELLQNARDAGARVVRLRVDRSGGLESISCRDDGEGMSFEHARRYLFTLYASSKAGERRSAGRFGIGFWSVLRLEPTAIVVRSRPPDGDGWELRLDGGLATADSRPLVMRPGTEVVLERPARAQDLEQRVFSAAHEDARYLRCRDDPARPLEVTVNDRECAAEFGLPAPSLAFARPGLRGAVSLTTEPRVEVFAHGLKVRAASFLDELLTAQPDASNSRSTELSEGLLPGVLLDSDRLRVLMARGDAREDRELEQLVELARRELGRLVRSELDRGAPGSGLGARLGDLWRSRWLRAAATVAVIGLVLGAVIGSVLRWNKWSGYAVRPSAVPPVEAAPSEPGPSAFEVAPYRDLARSYSGPLVHSLDDAPAVALRYRPETATPLFAAFRVTDPTRAGLDAKSLDATELLTHPDSPCDLGCLEVVLDVVAGAGVLRIPVATGHAVDPRSLRFDGVPAELWLTPAGEPALLLDGPRRGRLSYRSGPAAAFSGTRLPAAESELPASLLAAARDLEGRPRRQRVAAATELVRSMVRYDRSPDVAVRHLAAQASGDGVLDRALAIGAGDCDVQNSVLTLLLNRVGLPARLAVGYLGSKGRALPGLHAWVEYLEEDRWLPADASIGAPAPAAAAAARPRQAAAGSREGRPGVATEAQPPRPVEERVLPWPWLIGALLAAVLLAAVVVVGRRRALRRTLAQSDGADLERLLRGALLRPDAYGDVGSLYSRKMVPCVDGRSLSLRRAWQLAKVGRLYRSEQSSGLARSAAGHGVAVLDCSRSEGRVVADLLGARDLDSWDRALERAGSNLATDLVESAARRQGEHWRVRIVHEAPEPVASFEGRPLGLGADSRLVAVDASSSLWRAAAAELPGRPGLAAFVLADGVAHQLDLPAARRWRLLSTVARRAVAEGPK